MVELLFAPAEAGLVHLPEVLDHLAIGDAGHRDHARHHAMHGQGHGQYHTCVGVTITVHSWIWWRPPGKYDFLLNQRRRKREEEEADCRYIRLECRASPRSFVRKFRLPEDADAGAVAARCENGVLTVTVKKQPPLEKKTKSVQVAIA
ncbi:hypothetical protein VPH35_112746 [Triticum aestivum]